MKSAVETFITGVTHILRKIRIVHIVRKIAKKFSRPVQVHPSKPDGFCGIRRDRKRDEILRTLKEREAHFQVRGVTHAALFGSVARDEPRDDTVRATWRLSP